MKFHTPKIFKIFNAIFAMRDRISAAIRSFSSPQNQRTKDQSQLAIGMKNFTRLAARKGKWNPTTRSDINYQKWKGWGTLLSRQHPRHPPQLFHGLLPPTKQGKRRSGRTNLLERLNASFGLPQKLKFGFGVPGRGAKNGCSSRDQPGSEHPSNRFGGAHPRSPLN